MTVADRLASRVSSRQLADDSAQSDAARALDSVLERLDGSGFSAGWLFWRRPKAVRGLYLWGGVGRGKSMLMDELFAIATVPARRVHFHEFMGQVHARLARARARTDVSDPIPPVAKQFAAEARLLCFDEFQVSQIADAMILSRLFEHLFAAGVTVVATSNRPPEDLYKDGINRELFTPFIGLLKTHCEVLHLTSERDYRLERLCEAPVWLVGAGAVALDAMFERLTLGAPPQTCTLRVQGRLLVVPREAAGVARFSFEELCARPLGAQDYLAVAAAFHTVLIDDIPRLRPENRNEAARFVALIDALYEARVKLVATAAAAPDSLYQEGTGSFEFRRTASRLHEMGSADYMARPHRQSTVSQ